MASAIYQSYPFPKSAFLDFFVQLSEDAQRRAIFVTEKSAIQRIKELDLRGTVLFRKAKKKALKKAKEVISSTSIYRNFQWVIYLLDYQHFRFCRMMAVLSKNRSD
jgi:hypothetical protein